MPPPTLEHWSPRSSCLERASNRHGDASPTHGLAFELAAPGLGQPVVLGAAIVLRLAPFRAEPAFLLHAVQSGEERTGLDFKCPAGDLLNAARNSQTVHLAQGQGLQNEHVESPL